MSKQSKRNCKAESMKKINDINPQVPRVPKCLMSIDTLYDVKKSDTCTGIKVDLSDYESNWAKLKELVKQVLYKNPKGIDLEKFNYTYYRVHGKHLDPKLYRFNDIIDLLKNMGDTVFIKGTEPDNHILLLPKSGFSDLVKETPPRTPSPELPSAVIEVFRYIVREVHGIELENLIPEYEMRTGKKIDLTELGVISIPDLLSHLSGVFKVVERNDKYILYDSAIPDNQILENVEDHTDSILSTFESRKTLSDDTIVRLKKILQEEFPNGVELAELVGVYRGFFGATLEDLEPYQYGYTSLEGLLKAYPDVVRLWRSNGTVRIMGTHAFLSEEVTSKSAIPARVVRPGDSFQELDLGELLSVGGFVDVVVGEVYSPHRFWLIHRGIQTSQALDSMMDQMFEFYSSPIGDRYNVNKDAIVIGAPVVARFASDMNFYRALILSLEDLRTVKLFFVDYGTLCRCNISCLRYMHENFFTLPAQAFKAALYGIQPTNEKRAWPKEASQRFLTMIQDKALVAEIVLLQDTTQVHLWDTNGSEDISIEKVLIKDGLASPKSNNDECNQCVGLQTDSLPRWNAADVNLEKESKYNLPFQNQANKSVYQDQGIDSVYQDQVNKSVYQDQTIKSVYQDQVNKSVYQDQVNKSVYQNQVNKSVYQDQANKSVYQDQANKSVYQGQAIESAYQKPEYSQDKLGPSLVSYNSDLKYNTLSNNTAPESNPLPEERIYRNDGASQDTSLNSMVFTILSGVLQETLKQLKTLNPNNSSDEASHLSQPSTNLTSNGVTSWFSSELQKLTEFPVNSHYVAEIEQKLLCQKPGNQESASQKMNMPRPPPGFPPLIEHGTSKPNYSLDNSQRPEYNIIDYKNVVNTCQGNLARSGYATHNANMTPNWEHEMNRSHHGIVRPPPGFESCVKVDSVQEQIDIDGNPVSLPSISYYQNSPILDPMGKSPDPAVLHLNNATSSFVNSDKDYMPVSKFFNKETHHSPPVPVPPNQIEKVNIGFPPKQDQDDIFFSDGSDVVCEFEYEVLPRWISQNMKLHIIVLDGVAYIHDVEVSQLFLKSRKIGCDIPTFTITIKNYQDIYRQLLQHDYPYLYEENGKLVSQLNLYSLHYLSVILYTSDCDDTELLAAANKLVDEFIVVGDQSTSIGIAQEKSDTITPSSKECLPSENQQLQSGGLPEKMVPRQSFTGNGNDIETSSSKVEKDLKSNLDTKKGNESKILPSTTEKDLISTPGNDSKSSSIAAQKDLMSNHDTKNGNDIKISSSAIQKDLKSTLVTKNSTGIKTSSSAVQKGLKAAINTDNGNGSKTSSSAVQKNVKSTIDTKNCNVIKTSPITTEKESILDTENGNVVKTSSSAVQKNVKSTIDTKNGNDIKTLSSLVQKDKCTTDIKNGNDSKTLSSSIQKDLKSTLNTKIGNVIKTLPITTKKESIPNTKNVNVSKILPSTIEKDLKSILDTDNGNDIKTSSSAVQKNLKSTFNTKNGNVKTSSSAVQKDKCTTDTDNSNDSKTSSSAVQKNSNSSIDTKNCNVVKTSSSAVQKNVKCSIDTKNCNVVKTSSSAVQKDLKSTLDTKNDNDSKTLSSAVQKNVKSTIDTKNGNVIKTLSSTTEGNMKSTLVTNNDNNIKTSSSMRNTLKGEEFIDKEMATTLPRASLSDRGIGQVLSTTDKISEMDTFQYPTASTSLSKQDIKVDISPQTMVLPMQQETVTKLGNYTTISHSPLSDTPLISAKQNLDNSSVHSSSSSEIYFEIDAMENDKKTPTLRNYLGATCEPRQSPKPQKARNAKKRSSPRSDLIYLGCSINLIRKRFQDTNNDDEKTEPDFYKSSSSLCSTSSDSTYYDPALGVSADKKSVGKISESNDLFPSLKCESYQYNVLEGDQRDDLIRKVYDANDMYGNEFGTYSQESLTSQEIHKQSASTYHLNQEDTDESLLYDPNYEDLDESLLYDPNYKDTDESLLYDPNYEWKGQFISSNADTDFKVELDRGNPGPATNPRNAISPISSVPSETCTSESYYSIDNFTRDQNDNIHNNSTKSTNNACNTKDLKKLNAPGIHNNSIKSTSNNEKLNAPEIHNTSTKSTNNNTKDLEKLNAPVIHNNSIKSALNDEKLNAPVIHNNSTKSSSNNEKLNAPVIQNNSTKSTSNDEKLNAPVIHNNSIESTNNSNDNTKYLEKLNAPVIHNNSIESTSNDEYLERLDFMEKSGVCKTFSDSLNNNRMEQVAESKVDTTEQIHLTVADSDDLKPIEINEQSNFNQLSRPDDGKCKKRITSNIKLTKNLRDSKAVSENPVKDFVESDDKCLDYSRTCLRRPLCDVWHLTSASKVNQNISVRRKMPKTTCNMEKSSNSINISTCSSDREKVSSSNKEILCINNDSPKTNDTSKEELEKVEDQNISVKKKIPKTTGTGNIEKRDNLLNISTCSSNTEKASSGNKETRSTDSEAHETNDTVKESENAEGNMKFDEKNEPSTQKLTHSSKHFSSTVKVESETTSQVRDETVSTICKKSIEHYLCSTNKCSACRHVELRHNSHPMGLCPAVPMMVCPQHTFFDHSWSQFGNFPFVPYNPQLMAYSQQTTQYNYSSLGTTSTALWQPNRSTNTYFPHTRSNTIGYGVQGYSSSMTPFQNTQSNTSTGSYSFQDNSSSFTPSQYHDGMYW